MILVVNVCRERLHYYEFVKPVLDILKDCDILVSHYLDLKQEDLAICDKVIICGTSLKDNGFLENMDKFSWLKDFDKPVLGICAGFQILGLTFGGKAKKKTEIGFFHEKFGSEFLGLKGEVEVYHLHNNYALFGDEFEVFSPRDDSGEPAGDEVVQAVKSKGKDFYGVLFHPEVRNKEMILEFCRL